jgi:hypothetical protein
MLNATPLLRIYAAYRNAQLSFQNPATTQERQLRWLIAQARDTKFGRDHQFSSINTIAQFQERVRLRKYEDFWNEYWKESFPTLINNTWPGQIRYFCWTSGTTTGKRKYIPYSDAMARSYNKAGTDLLVHHVTNRPDSKIFGGKSFMLGGTTHMTEEAPGVHTCEISGVSATRLPAWARPFFFPPRDLSNISSWVERTEKIAEAARGQDVRLMGGMPSWTLIFLEKFRELGGVSEGILGRLFPNLEMFVHGGVKFDPYLKQYKSLLAGTHAELREVYPASEGFIAVADRGYGEGLRMVLDAGIFYEFVPVEELNSPSPTRHWIGNVQKDVNYAIVLNSCAGAWGYLIGDTVRFVDTKTPRILITGRTAYAMSAFGEHLILEEVERAVSESADALNITVNDYCMGARVAPNGSSQDLGNHIYLIELAQNDFTPELAKDLAQQIDKRLLDLNDDYADHRNPGCGLLAPEVRLLKPGTFAAWMASRGKLGDQHKVPRLMSDRTLFASACDFADTY